MPPVLEESDRILGALFSRLTSSSPSKVTHDAPNAAVSSRGERTRASGLLHCEVRRPNRRGHDGVVSESYDVSAAPRAANPSPARLAGAPSRSASGGTR